MTSRDAELLISIDRSRRVSMQAQVEMQLRDAIRNGTLRSGSEVPSTRDLARGLGISRPVVIEAYAQLAAEGYLCLRQGAVPRVADTGQPRAARDFPPERHNALSFRYDFRPGSPDLSTFPSGRWLKSLEAALKVMTPQDFGYGQRYAVMPLRWALAEYLGRVRGVRADPRQIFATGGFEQSKAIAAGLLRSRGATTLALEDPGYYDREVWLAAGLKLVPIPVDEDGIDVDALIGSGAQAVLITPAHQSPTGVVMSGARRLALARWLRENDALAIEDDYDAEFRYDRAPVGALQGLAPDHVVYAGTASKTLAPALRLGWLVVPPDLLPTLEDELRLRDCGRGRIEQFALAHFIRTGDYDRHLRKMRALYGARREALLAAIGAELPETEIGGISAGLHATVRFPQRLNEAAIIASANKRGMGLSFIRRHYLGAAPDESTLLLNYASMTESVLRTALRTLAMIVRDTLIR